MTWKVDESNRIITVSVTELCSEELCSGSLNLLPFREIRGELGREAHKRYQSEQVKIFSEYRCEVPFCYEYLIEGFQIIIQGRLDGVLLNQDKWVVEEIKSTLRSVKTGDLSLVHSKYLLQLKLYLYFWSKIKKTKNVRGQLVIINCTNFQRVFTEVGLDSPAMEQFLEDQLIKIVKKVGEQLIRKNERLNEVRSLTFPFPRMRKYQGQLIESIQSALQLGESLLISAPTGIGKTVAALFASLSIAQKQNRPIFFLTSKTTQQRIVADTLRLWESSSKKEVDWGRFFSALILRSKEKSCANDVVCCHESRCDYARDFYGKLESSNVRNSLASFSLLTPDLVFQTAVKNEICPFELSLDLLSEVNLVVCDYNYLYDPNIFFNRKIIGKDSSPIVIIDEAHNLYSRARDYYSPRLDLKKIQTLKNKIQSPQMMLNSNDNQENGRDTSMGYGEPSFEGDLTDCLTELERFILELRSNNPENSENNQFCVSLDKEFFENIQNDFESLLRRYLIDKKKVSVWTDEDDFIELARSVDEFCTVLQLKGEEFVYVLDRKDNSDQLRILCLNPAPQLAKRHKHFHSVISMSATLSPLEFYRDVLGFDTDSKLLSLPSPFPPENRKVTIINEVSTLYRHRSSSAPRIAQIIEEIVAIHSGNYLVFFPSFEFLGIVVKYLNPVGYRLLVQKRTMGDHSRNAFLDSLAKREQSHFLLGVQGGVFSEGVDYLGKLALGVIIVGPGLPKMNYETDLTRLYFQEQSGKGFEYAYLFPGMNRVIQSAGRVIRSESDNGVIVLIGRRFGYEAYMDLFPRDWYDSSPIELVSKSYVKDISHFWSQIDNSLDLDK